MRKLINHTSVFCDYYVENNAYNQNAHDKICSLLLASSLCVEKLLQMLKGKSLHLGGFYSVRHKGCVYCSHSV
jgi:hypothetical protein